MDNLAHVSFTTSINRPVIKLIKQLKIMLKCLTIFNKAKINKIPPQANLSIQSTLYYWTLTVVLPQYKVIRSYTPKAQPQEREHPLTSIILVYNNLGKVATVMKNPT